MKAQAMPGWLRRIAGCAVAGAAVSAGAQVVWPVSWDGDNSPVLIVNGTAMPRSYAVISAVDPDAKIDITRHFTLPAGGACRVDTGVYLNPPLQPQQERFQVTTGLSDRDTNEGLYRVTRWGYYVEDVSEGPRGVMNGPLQVLYQVDVGNFVIRDSNIAAITTCSARGLAACAGARWGSWKVGLMVAAAQRYSYDEWISLDYLFMAPLYAKSVRSPVTIELQPDHLYWPWIAWQGHSSMQMVVRAWPKALVLIQNGLDGQGSDAMDPISATLRSRMAFGEAPLCSQYP